MSLLAGNAFPSSFESIVKKIHRYLFHVIAHLYQAHFKELTCLKLHGHLNTLFQHFMTFNKHFTLLEERETEPLDDLYRKLEEEVPLISVTPDPEDPSSNDNGKGDGGSPTKQQSQQRSPSVTPPPTTTSSGDATLTTSTTVSTTPTTSVSSTTLGEENKENDNREVNQDNRKS